MIGIAGLIGRFGLPAVFLGSFVEGETVVTVAGFLAHQGLLALPGVAVAGFAGCVAADQMYFHLARRNAGVSLVRRLADSGGGRTALALVARHPLLFGTGFRFVPGMRMTGPVAIGLAGVSPLRFLTMDVVASAVWAALYAGLGYGASRAGERLFGDLSRLEHQLGAALLVAVPLAGAAWWWRRRMRHPKRRRG